MTADGTILGIDLGTTNSVVAVFRGGRPEVLPNALGRPLTPSAVARDPRTGTLCVGRAAKDILAVEPSAGAAFFKRAMGTDRRFGVAGERLSAVELSALVLASLRADAERALGHPASRAVISVPAYFDEGQRVATRKAGELAGLTVERIINEPTAAAIAYGLHQTVDEQLVLVVDLGGGTFDVCVMELFEGALEVRSTAGQSDLGGEDFTRCLRVEALKEVGLVGERAEVADPHAWSLLYTRCERLKRRLSEAEAASVVVPPFRGALDAPRTVEVTRTRAHGTWERLLSRMTGPLRSALRGAQVGRGAVERVLLVGGATRMPVVRALVTELFEREPHTDIDPDLAIALGAATQAALCADDAAVTDLVVTDVASHTIGVEVTRHLAGSRIPGYFSPVIHRNTVLPTSRTATFHTIDPDQRRISLRIFEGEARRVADNRLIGALEVTGIPAGPPGQDVHVTLTFDLDGILEVEAKVAKTGHTISALFERAGRTLTAAERHAAEGRIAQIRADPTQRPDLRDLLARADLLCRDLVGEAREVADQLIHQLEDAIQARTPSRIDAAARELGAFCDRWDQGERW